MVASKARPPKSGETSALPELDEVVVFHDLFTAELLFPLDPIFVDTLRLHNMYLHQLTPNAVAHLNLYF